MATKFLGKRHAATDSPSTLEVIKGIKTIRKRLKEVYIILGADVNDTEEDILADPNLPDINTTVDGYLIHKITPKETATVIHPDSGDQTILWEVTVDGDDKFDEAQSSGSGSGEMSTVEILNATPVEEWDSVEEDEQLTADPTTGFPFTTVNGEPIIVTRKAVYPVLTIQRIENYPFNPVTIHQFSNKTNSQTFRGALPGWALMLPPKAELFVFGSHTLSKVTYRIKFRTEAQSLFGTSIRSDGSDVENSDVTPFMVRVLHQGTKHRIELPDGSLTDPVVWLDENGSPATVNLDYEGIMINDPTNPVFIVGDRHRTVDFNLLFGSF